MPQNPTLYLNSKIFSFDLEKAKKKLQINAANKTKA
jgi:hypothetical protein